MLGSPCPTSRACTKFSQPQHGHRKGDFGGQAPDFDAIVVGAGFSGLYEARGLVDLVDEGRGAGDAIVGNRLDCHEYHEVGVNT